MVRRPGEPRAGPRERALVQDPNCLTHISIDRALKTCRDGAPHYFCRRECAEAFEKKEAKSN